MNNNINQDTQEDLIRIQSWLFEYTRTNDFIREALEKRISALEMKNEQRMTESKPIELPKPNQGEIVIKG
jgi:hypothetical protein